MCIFVFLGSHTLSGDTSNTASSSQSTDTSTPPSHQKGFGDPISDRLITKLTDAISNRLEEKYPSLQQAPTFPNWQYYDTVQPTSSSSVRPANTTPPIQFEVPVLQNRLNDTFDLQKLLKDVPTPYKKNAKVLVNIIEQQPNDISCDSSGTLYINGESVPNSNMNVLLPALFRKRVKKITGIEELVAKIKQMGLTHLLTKSTTTKTAKQFSQEESKSSKGANPNNWWFLK